MRRVSAGWSSSFSSVRPFLSFFSWTICLETRPLWRLVP
ncbi:hypothetical protein CCUS01_12537 [Colletotrichum cuscutae]|uniref:Uncharacterized protein n=1 Tax=Colletotrichum cuscutae TaxID=1209917 RepID=A0AAI9XEM4_9PEZI|nr:hypothetical protein CCUS01_12537 [Colletotrichum cuscutae]